MEIEKKFRVVKLPENLNEFKKKKISQGYLSKSPVVRIRKSNDDYILTYKNHIVDKPVDIRVCREEEMPLTRESFEHLSEKIDGNMVEKTRYLIPLKTGHTAELDIFEGNLKGLYFVEVEFASISEAQEFQKPEWFGEDVSHDKRFGNSYLSELENWTES